MMEAYLVPRNTVVKAEDNRLALDLGHAAGRVFLLTFAIANIATLREVRNEILARSRWTRSTSVGVPVLASAVGALPLAE
jgi:hypothetical protein